VACRPVVHQLAELADANIADSNPAAARHHVLNLIGTTVAEAALLPLPQLPDVAIDLALGYVDAPPSTTDAGILSLSVAPGLAHG
jgi:hypothetical protein